MSARKLAIFGSTLRSLFLQRNDLHIGVGCAAVQVTLPYTLAVFFVRDFASGPLDNEEHVGKLTGFLVLHPWLA